MNNLIDENPDNIKYLNTRANLHKDNKQFELQISDLMKVLSIIDSNKIYSILDAANTFTLHTLVI